MAAYWPTADADPTAPAYLVEFARRWKETPKVVFSTTPDQVGWNTRLVRGGLVDEVVRLKQQPGKKIEVGGASIAATLLRHGLIDEVQLYVQPVILGGGTPMFPALAEARRLRLVDTRVFRSGVVFLRYQRADDAR